MPDFQGHAMGIALFRYYYPSQIAISEAMKSSWAQGTKKKPHPNRRFQSPDSLTINQLSKNQKAFQPN